MYVYVCTYRKSERLPAIGKEGSLCAILLMISSDGT